MFWFVWKILACHHGLSSGLEIISDVVLLILKEHLHDLRKSLSEIHRVLKPGGVFVFDTINRTWWSWVMGILVAQETIGIVPPNAHDWRLFITPEELKRVLEETGFEVTEYPASWRGMSLFPKIFKFLTSFSVLKSIGSAETADLSVNYLGWARKKSTM
jgi:2-polyprenyl-3-methyl-5-hydroxy-6-metoxy-1,4-benzoquinol methylase